MVARIQNPGGIFNDQIAHIGDDRRARIVVAGILCLLIAYVGCGLRFWSRHVGKIALWFDDLAILVALLLFSVFTALALVEVDHGLGRHLVLIQNDYVAFAKVSGLQPVLPQERF